MFVTNWISTTKIQKISEITNFFRHYFLSRTEVKYILSKIINKQPRQKDTHDSPFSSLTFQIHIHIHISSLYNHRILPVTSVTFVIA